MAKPIPLVLSLLIIEHRNANDEKISEINTALIKIDIPAVLNENIINGMPTEISKAINNDMFNP